MTTPETPIEPTADAPDPDDVESFVETLFGHILGAQAVQAAYLGDRLGWYQALADGGPLTATELAERTETTERYAREWLEHQTVAGYVTCLDATAAPAGRRFELPAAHAEVLTDRDSLSHVLPLARFVVGVGTHAEEILEAYRSGQGVSWGELGQDPREAQADQNRPMFLGQLGQEYLASIPEVDAALQAGGRVADVGGGGAWASIGVARSYPAATVDSYDVDGPSVELARRNIAEAGLADRVTAHHVDVAQVPAPDDDEAYDLVMALETIHDLPDPVSVLRAMRGLAGSGGTVIVMDERVGDRFTGEPDEVEQLMYGYSLMCCLPDGLAHDHSVGTGTVMRSETLVGYATEAGFGGVEILDIDNDFFRFYRLR